MDSKPIAIIIAIVITIGAMGAVIVTSTNTLSGTSSTSDFIIKNPTILQIDPKHLEVNVEFINSGSDTFNRVGGAVDIDGNTRELLTNLALDVKPYETAYLSASVKNTGLFSYQLPGSTSPDWDIYPGDTVILHIQVVTESGDGFQKLYKVIVQ